MKRLLLALLLFVLCLAAAVLAVVFGAYAGLAPATGWMHVAAAVVFVAVLAFGATSLVDAAAPLVSRAPLTLAWRFGLLVAFAVAATGLWFLFFWTGG